MDADGRRSTRMKKRWCRLIEFVVVYEWTGSNWSAYSPDVPGCAATGATREDVEAKYREALEFHIEGLRLHGEPVPIPSSRAGVVSVAP